MKRPPQQWGFFYAALNKIKARVKTVSGIRIKTKIECALERFILFDTSTARFFPLYPIQFLNKTKPTTPMDTIHKLVSSKTLSFICCANLIKKTPKTRHKAI